MRGPADLGPETRESLDRAVARFTTALDLHHCEPHPPTVLNLAAPRALPARAPPDPAA